MNEILCRQLAIDYCTTPEAVMDGRNHFTPYRRLEGRRRFQEEGNCHLKLAVANGKLLFSGEADILAWCREQYGDVGGAWFFEPENLVRLDGRLGQDGYKIKMAHPFFIAERPTPADAEDFVRVGGEIRWYVGKEIEAFRGDSRYGEAFAFSEEAPDELGVAAIRDGSILGMAGASSDSPFLWQIGINVNPESRQAGIGTMLVSLLKNEILRRGRLPYYGTAFSHLASQRVALGAGFLPAWVELATARRGSD